MLSFKDSEMIQELKIGNSFGYVLSDNNMFDNTSYKVLINQASEVFVKCMTTAINGKLEIMYLTDGYKSVASMLGKLDPDTFLTVVTSIFDAIIETYNNGFLYVQNIDLSWDKVFVDTSTNKVKLVYVPLNCSVFTDYSSFEFELRSGIIQIINENIHGTYPDVNRLAQNLANNSMSIAEINNTLKSVRRGGIKLSGATSLDLGGASGIGATGHTVSSRVTSSVGVDNSSAGFTEIIKGGVPMADWGAGSSGGAASWAGTKGTASGLTSSTEATGTVKGSRNLIINMGDKKAGTSSVNTTVNSGAAAFASSYQTGLKLVAVNSSARLEILLNRDRITIGKNRAQSDFVIDGNNAISRKHCTIYKTDSGFYIIDENSSNGTFVNGIKVNAGQKVKIKKGDMISLANQAFQVV